MSYAQRSPTFLAPGVCFVEDSSSTDGAGGSGGVASDGVRQVELTRSLAALLQPCGPAPGCQGPLGGGVNDPSKGDIRALSGKPRTRWMDPKEQVRELAAGGLWYFPPIPAGRDMQPQRKTEEQVLALSVLESVSSSPL